MTTFSNYRSERKGKLMKCYCCERDVAETFHVKLRGNVTLSVDFKSPDDPAYLSYEKDMTFRSAFVCFDCYRILDSEDGTGSINGRVFAINGASRGGKAARYDEKKYRAFQKKNAARLGIELD